MQCFIKAKDIFFLVAIVYSICLVFVQETHGISSQVQKSQENDKKSKTNSPLTAPSTTSQRTKMSTFTPRTKPPTSAKKLSGNGTLKTPLERPPRSAEVLQPIYVYQGDVITNKEIAITNPIIHVREEMRYTEDLKNPKMFTKIVNPHKIPFLESRKNFCHDNPDLYVLAVVHTAPGNSEHRRIIRETWASKNIYKKLGIRALFFVGLTSNKTTAKNLEEESLKYQDIIIQDYFDSYRNLTFKVMSWLEWVTTYCEDVPYVLKMDDDVIANVFQLVDMLHDLDENFNHTRSSLMMCHKILHARVFRKSSGTKWSISHKDYPDPEYPTYCHGYAVIMSGALIPKMHNASYYIPFFWIDDVYFTGHLTSRLSVDITDISHLCVPIADGYNLVQGQGIFTYSDINDPRMRFFWDMIYEVFYLQQQSQDVIGPNEMAMLRLS